MLTKDGLLSLAAFATSNATSSIELLGSVLDFGKGGIDFNIIDDRSFNGAAGRGKKPKTYVASINIGAIKDIDMMFDHSPLVSDIKPKSLIFRDREGEELGAFAKRAVVMFLLYHELSHIVRGHIDFLNPRREHNFQICEVDANEKRFSQHYARKRYICECDADTHAGKLLGYNILISVHKLRDMLCSKLSDEEFLKDIVYVVSCALQVVFAYMELKRSKPSRLYAPPPMRVGMALGQVYQEFNGMVSVDDGIEQVKMSVEAVKKYKFVGIGNLYDLYNSLDEWERADMPILNNIDVTLTRYAPFRLKNITNPIS